MPLKVYGGHPIIPECPGRRQTRMLVCARSMAAARRFLAECGVHLSPNEMRNYWGDTGNEKELTIATEEGDIFWRPIDDYTGTWTRLERREDDSD